MEWERRSVGNGWEKPEQATGLTYEMFSQFLRLSVISGAARVTADHGRVHHAFGVSFFITPEPVSIVTDIQSARCDNAHLIGGSPERVAQPRRPSKLPKSFSALFWS